MEAVTIPQSTLSFMQLKRCLRTGARFRCIRHDRAEKRAETDSTWLNRVMLERKVVSYRPGSLVCDCGQDEVRDIYFEFPKRASEVRFDGTRFAFDQGNGRWGVYEILEQSWLA